MFCVLNESLAIVFQIVLVALLSLATVLVPGKGQEALRKRYPVNPLSISNSRLGFLYKYRDVAIAGALH